MKKHPEKEVNRGYIDFIRGISRPEVKTRKTFGSVLRALWSRALDFAKLLFLPLLILYGILLIAALQLRLLLSKRGSPSGLHGRAEKYVVEFTSQYPMHFYPVVAKALELAFLKEHLADFLGPQRGGIAELAAGEGTLSARFFPEDAGIFAFDLNPYSLVHTAGLPHITRRIVADCLEPPIGPGGASLIVSNNFMHHVSNKEKTLENWSKVSEFVIFNENSPYWVSGWFTPFLLARLGFAKTARKVAGGIESRGYQSLMSSDDLRELVSRFYEITQETTFLSERVFFLCAVSSSLLFSYGPPTPERQKKMLNGILRPISRFLTGHACRALIRYDALLPRGKDAFISWVAKSRKTVPSRAGRKEIILVCPDCRGILQDDHCPACNRTFEVRDGMLFLLPREIAKDITYAEEKTLTLGREHL